MPKLKGKSARARSLAARLCSLLFPITCNLSPAFRYDIDFAEEGVAPGVVIFRWNGIEEQVAKFAQAAAGIRDAHTVLASALALLWPRINRGDQFPAASSGVGFAVGLGIEPGIGAVAGKKVIDLGCARVRMPRIAVNRRYLNDAA